jgi:hypothetical protein
MVCTAEGRFVCPTWGSTSAPFAANEFSGREAMRKIEAHSPAFSGAQNVKKTA